MKCLSQLVAAICIVLPASAAIADVTSRGGVSLESRAFAPDDDDSTEDVGMAVSSQLEVGFRSKPLSVVARGFARLDALDEDRNIVNLQEGYAALTTDRVTLRLGSQIIDSTATEAFHPVNIVNSRNLDSDIENQEKLGEPMVELRVRVLRGEIAAYFMPARIAPNIAPSSSRLSVVPAGVELGDVLWLDRNGSPSDRQFAPQSAAHISQTIGPADIALHFVDHNDRHEPTFTIDPDTGEVRPTLHWVTQVGLTYVHVVGPLIFKLEAAHRMFNKPDEDSELELAAIPDHQKVALGLEYVWTTSAGHDASLVAEGQTVLGTSRDARKQLDVFQRDVLVGYRHSFNNVNASELFVAFISDVETPNEYVAALRYGQRLTDTWSVGASAHSIRIFERAIQQVQLTLTRNF